MDEIMQEEKSEMKKEGKGRGKDPRKDPRSSTPYIWMRNEMWHPWILRSSSQR